MTHDEAQYIRLSTCLWYRDAHEYAFFFLFTKGSTGGKSWERGSLQTPKCWCAMGSRNGKPSANGSRELPNSASKTLLEKAVRTEAKGCGLQTARCCTPFDGFPLTPWRGGAPLGGERKPGWDGSPLFCSNPAVSP